MMKSLQSKWIADVEEAWYEQGPQEQEAELAGNYFGVLTASGEAVREDQPTQRAIPPNPCLNVHLSQQVVSHTLKPFPGFQHRHR